MQPLPSKERFLLAKIPEPQFVSQKKEKTFTQAQQMQNGSPKEFTTPTKKEI